ncbi:hypothetical protein MVEN_00898100 [Mycena venus]|uniref:Uncharacterized protein n=1 Tax=Mycena venus TaxID=2733690 RepID=A0A8H6YHN8_9AGAR|nr:hypothetical protein MVEN_00898100 [Mycena venus]
MASNRNNNDNIVQQLDDAEAKVKQLQASVALAEANWKTAFAKRAENPAANKAAAKAQLEARAQLIVAEEDLQRLSQEYFKILLPISNDNIVKQFDDAEAKVKQLQASVALAEANWKTAFAKRAENPAANKAAVKALLEGRAQLLVAEEELQRLSQEYFDIIPQAPDSGHK